MTEEEKQEIVDRVCDQILKHSSFVAVWEAIEKTHNEQMKIAEQLKDDKSTGKHAQA